MRPHVSESLDWEGELAVIIGKGGRDIPEADACDHVAGYSCYNDASVREWQFHAKQIASGKNFESTGGFGPWMVTADEIAPGRELKLETRLNGETVQSSHTGHMIFSIPQLIAYASTIFTLVPGDVIATGTPAGVGWSRKPPRFMKPGDVVEVEIEGHRPAAQPDRRAETERLRHSTQQAAGNTAPRRGAAAGRHGMKRRQLRRSLRRRRSAWSQAGPAGPRAGLSRAADQDLPGLRARRQRRRHRARGRRRDGQERWASPSWSRRRPAPAAPSPPATVARAKPDGYTLLLATGGHAVAGALYSTLPYRSVADFEMISTITFFPFLVVVGADSKLQGLRRGAGGGACRAGHRVLRHGRHRLDPPPGRRAAGQDGRARRCCTCPTAAMPPSLTALLGGDVPFIIAPPTAVMSNIQAGKLRALATTGPQRWPGLPNVPTVAEQGVPGYDVRSWAGLMAPAGTPRPSSSGCNAETHQGAAGARPCASGSRTWAARRAAARPTR